MPGPGTGTASGTQQYDSSGMPVRAVDMSRAGGTASALADAAATGLVRL